PTNMNVNNFKKELHYPDSSDGAPSGNNNFINTALPVGQWFGHKFVYQHYSNGADVHLEMWIDKSNNGTWQKWISYNDTGAWSGKVACTGGSVYHIITESLPDIFTRNTGITEADYKYFSIREINQLP